jgi:hypothetical protein
LLAPALSAARCASALATAPLLLKERHDAGAIGTIAPYLFAAANTRLLR